MFSLELVPEFSALKFLYILQNFFSIIASYKLILLKYTEEDLRHLQHLRWIYLLPTFDY